MELVNGRLGLSSLISRPGEGKSTENHKGFRTFRRWNKGASTRPAVSPYSDQDAPSVERCTLPRLSHRCNPQLQRKGGWGDVLATENILGLCELSTSRSVGRRFERQLHNPTVQAGLHKGSAITWVLVPCRLRQREGLHHGRQVTSTKLDSGRLHKVINGNSYSTRVTTCYNGCTRQVGLDATVGTPAHSSSVYHVQSYTSCLRFNTLLEEYCCCTNMLRLA